MWLAIACVIVIVLIVVYLRTARGESMADGADNNGGSELRTAIAWVTLPAHNSGKPSMWLPSGIQPAYFWRRLTWIENCAKS